MQMHLGFSGDYLGIASTVTRGAVQPRGLGKALGLLHTGKAHARGGVSALKKACRRHVEEAK